MRDTGVTRNRSLALPVNDTALTTPISGGAPCALSVQVSLPSADPAWAGLESEGAGRGGQAALLTQQ